MTEDSDLDKSLVCREIIERSPEILAPGGTQQYSGSRTPSGTPQYSGNRTPGGTPSYSGNRTPGGTPSYSGNKSPEESSELDLKSLTGSPKRTGSDFESLIAD